MIFSHSFNYLYSFMGILNEASIGRESIYGLGRIDFYGLIATGFYGVVYRELFRVFSSHDFVKISGQKNGKHGTA